MMAFTVPILMYHSVDTGCAPAYRRWMVLPEEFDGHMAALAGGGYRPVTVSEIVRLFQEGIPVPPHTVAITFDDGFTDFARGALPLLQRYGFPATLYVVSGVVGGTGKWLSSLGEGDRPMLDWSGLREVADAGIEIGAHTVSHPQLDILPADEASREITDSKHALEDGLGRAVRSFAYPHGYSSAKTRELVRAAGFSSACRVRHALASSMEDRFGLSRIIVTSEIGPGELCELISGGALPIAPPADRLIGTGWRMVRRLRHYSLRRDTKDAHGFGYQIK